MMSWCYEKNTIQQAKMNETSSNLRPVKGTMTVFAVRGKRNRVVETRSTPFYCGMCLQSEARYEWALQVLPVEDNSQSGQEVTDYADKHFSNETVASKEILGIGPGGPTGN